MPAFDVSSPLLAVLSALSLGALSGIVPTGMAEALAVGIGLVASPRVAVLMWLAFTCGHVAAKLPWYWLGMHADRAGGPRAVAWVARAQGLLARRPGYGAGLLFVSAVASVPPFHLAAIAAGLVRLRPLPFLALCLVGRLIRFGVLVASPGLLRALIG